MAVYSYWIYRREATQVTSVTKAEARKGKKPITEVKYKKVNRKSYKNIDWMRKMYKKKTEEQSMQDIFPVILPNYYYNGFPIYRYNKEGNLYHFATVIDERPNNVLMVVKIEKTGNKELFWKEYLTKTYLKTAAGDFPRDGVAVREEDAREDSRD